MTCFRPKDGRFCSYLRVAIILAFCLRGMITDHTSKLSWLDIRRTKRCGRGDSLRHDVERGNRQSEFGLFR